MSEPHYGFVLPFVTCASNGGPHDDESYATGWAMGSLWTCLESTYPPSWQDTIRTDSIPQADLIAMHFGYRAEFTSGPIAEWSMMTLTRVSA